MRKKKQNQNKEEINKRHVLRTYPRTQLSKFCIFQNTRMFQNKISLYSACIQAAMYVVSNEICITVFSKLILESVVFANYCAGDKIEKNKVGWACGAYG